jgi:outer membrane protein
MRKIIQHSILALLLIFCVTVTAQKKWTLEECISYAKEHNSEVLKQKIRNEISKSDIKIAKGNFLPDANFNASQNFSLGNSFNVSTGVGQLESSSNSFSLSSSVPIFNGFSNKYKLVRSKKNLEKGEADLDNIRFDISLNIVNKYLQVLFNKEIEKVAREQLKISQNNLERLQLLFKNALTSKRELLEIESTFASDKKEIVIAENNVKTSIIELAQLLDVKELVDFDVIDLESNSEEGNIISSNLITDNVIDNNPLIKSSAFSIELRKEDVKISKANFYPRVNLSYSYSSNYFHILGRDDTVFNQETGLFENNGFLTQLNNNRTHYIGVSASIPIFNRFSTKENFKKSQEEVKISEIELENQKLQLKSKIKIAISDLEASKASLNASTIALETQKKAFEIVQEQFNEGNLTNFEFLESKSKLIKNTSDFIKAKYELLFKKKIVEFYMKL